MNQCVFLAGLRLQQFSFYRGKILICHQVPIPRFSKTHLPVFHSCVRAFLGHTVPSHEKKVRGECSVSFDYHSCHYPDQANLFCHMTSQQEVASSCFFLKTQKIDQSYCFMMRNMNQGAFLSSLRLQLSSCYRVKILVLPACESCVKTLLGCTVRFHEKRGQGRVFCEC